MKFLKTSSIWILCIFLIFGVSGVFSQNIVQSNVSINGSTQFHDSTKYDIPILFDWDGVLADSNHQLTADLTNIDLLDGGIPHLAGVLDLNNDFINDLILIVEHISHESLSGYSLLLLDGSDLSPLIEPGSQTNELINGQPNFAFSVSFEVFSNNSGQDVGISFIDPETQFCKGILFNIDTSIDYFHSTSFEIACQNFQSWTDYNADGFVDYVVVDDAGNTFRVDLKETLETNTTIDITESNILPQGVSSPVENFKFHNLTNNGLIDYSFTKYHPGNDTTTIYFVDSSDNSLISNVNVLGEILSLVPIDLDNSGNNEVIVQTSSFGNLNAISANGTFLEFNDFPFGSSDRKIQISGDLDNDQIPDLFITDNLGTIYILSGKNGELILPAISTFELGFNGPLETTISTLPITNFSKLIVFQNQEGSHLIQQENEFGNSLIFSEPWTLDIISTHIANTQQITFQQLERMDVRLDQDQDLLSLFNEFLIGSDDQSKDTDGDGLDDFEEFQIRTSLVNNDTDFDGMTDDFEVIYDLNPLIHDSSQDADSDDLSNLDEFLLGLDPTNADSDDDEMPDGWEFFSGLDPTSDLNRWGDTDGDGLRDAEEYDLETNPTNIDTDGDLMDDEWEVENSLNPKLDDSNLDLDDDGLSNLEEYRLGLDPQIRDQDKDDLPDGWEINNGLNPLNPNDRNEDLDSDFIPNNIEYKYGMNPNGKFDQFLAISFIVLTITTPIISIIVYRRLSINARNEGFSSFREKRQLKKLGFTTLLEFEEAKKLGYNTAAARNLILSFGAERLDELVDGWVKFEQNLTKTYDEQDLDVKKSEIANSTSPIELSDIEEGFQTIFHQMESNLSVLERSTREIDSILELSRRSKEEQIIGVEQYNLKTLQNQFQNHISNLNDKISTLKVAFEKQKTWFVPWASLLSLIQITVDMVPVDLGEIAKITNSDEDHVEKLLRALLEQNPLIGSYDEETKVYTKGIGINDYIDQALKEINNSLELSAEDLDDNQ